MKAAEIGRYLKNLLPEDLLRENLKYTPMQEDGLRCGDGDIEVRGILVCWMATDAAIAYAVDKGCNLIICHEEPWYRDFSTTEEVSDGWPANRRRRQLLEDNGITVYRCHSPLDVLYNTDAALDAMDLKIESLYSEWIARVAAVEPVSVAELMRRACRGFDVPTARLIGDASRMVTKVGISIGGMGLSFNGFFNEWLHDQGAEVIITGEVDEYGAFWAVENGVDIIAVGHAAMENPGLKRFLAKLQEDYPRVPACFYECRTP